MKKKFKISFVLLIAMLIALTGCGAKENKGASTVTAPTAASNTPSEKTADAKPSNQPLQELTLATIGDTAVSGPIYYALDKDIFGKHGLKVTRKTLDPSAAVAALISGDIQIVAGGGPGVVDAAIKTDNVKVIGTHGQIAMWLYAKNITKLEELKGKTIGATTAGGAIDNVTKTLIRSIGMKQGKDVNILYAGTPPAIIATMSEGKIEAGVIDLPARVNADQMGLKKVAYLNDLKGILGLYGVMGVNQPFATKNQKVIVNYMKAFSEASKLMKTDKEGAKAAISKFTRLTDDKVLEEIYAAHKNLFPTDLHIPDSEVQYILDELSLKNPSAKMKKPADVIDNRYADAVK